MCCVPREAPGAVGPSASRLVWRPRWFLLARPDAPHGYPAKSARKTVPTGHWPALTTVRPLKPTNLGGPEQSFASTSVKEGGTKSCPLMGGVRRASIVRLSAVVRVTPSAQCAADCNTFSGDWIERSSEGYGAPRGDSQRPRPAAPPHNASEFSLHSTSQCGLRRDDVSGALMQLSRGPLTGR